MRILAISGSLRRDSHNTNLLRAAAELLPPGTELDLLDADTLRAIPPFDEDEQDRPADSVEDLRRSIGQADAVLFSTPEYNHSIPGQLKNALDWLSRPLATSPLRAKPVAVVGASTSLFGAVWAQAELRKVLTAIGASVLDRELPIAQAATRFGDQGNLVDDELRAQLAELAAALVEAVEAPRAVAA